MLLSGPPSTLIFIEPGVQINAVVHAAATKLDERNPQLGKQRDADPQVGSGLFPREAAHSRMRQQIRRTVVAIPNLSL